MTSEIQMLIARARERMAEQDADDAAQRAAGYTLPDRHAEFCGAFRELLDMLCEELDGATVVSPAMAAALGRHETGTGWPVDA